MDEYMAEPKKLVDFCASLITFSEMPGLKSKLLIFIGEWEEKALLRNDVRCLLSAIENSYFQNDELN